MDQPTRDDDVAAWRKYAGDLRQRLGQAYADARAAEQRAAEAEAELALSQRRGKRTRVYLNRVHRLLTEGDVPGAIDVLALRRKAIQRAAAQSGENTRPERSH
jgi:hypothetical protein